MIRNDTVKLLEPEVSQRSKNFAFFRDRIAENNVKGGNTIGSDNQKFIVADSIAVANFAAVDERK